MKINLESSANRKEITNVRKQITNSADLKNFDVFLSTHKVIDLNDEKTVSRARACCSGDACCQFEFHVSAT
jgi:hypothetical protein